MFATRGPALRPGEDGYDQERAGYNLARAEDRPALVVGAEGPEDVRSAVSHAAERGLGVAVRATGHGISGSTQGQLLINTRRMQDLRLDPRTRTATVGAGVRWHRVLAEASVHGLAPLSGSNPDVGVVGYTLGGGVGLLGRRHGFAADKVRSLDVVTADGRLRHVTAESEPELFWGLRGGKDNLGVVVSLEFELVPVTGVTGGGYYFPEDAVEAALHGWAEWTRDVPEEMSSSIQLIRYPDLPVLPEPLRGRFVAHLRIAWSGRPQDAEPLLAPLRALGPTLLETVRPMPMTEIGSIHHEPPLPAPSYDRNTALRALPAEAVDTLLRLAGPKAQADAAAPVILELRHQGGAYRRAPAVPSVVGGRDAEYLLFTTAVLEPGSLDALRATHGAVHAAVRPWSTGGTFVNFLGIDDATPEAVRSAYTPQDHRRLATLKALYDPDNLFRGNYNVPPQP